MARVQLNLISLGVHEHRHFVDHENVIISLLDVRIIVERTQTERRSTVDHGNGLNKCSSDIS